MLERRKGGSDQLLLRVRGRDLDGDIELVLTRDKAGNFMNLGDPGASAALDPNRREVVEHLQHVGDVGATASEVMLALGRGTLSSITKLLGRMAEDSVIDRRDKHYFRVCEPLSERAACPVPVHPPRHSRRRTASSSSAHI